MILNVRLYLSSSSSASPSASSCVSISSREILRPPSIGMLSVSCIEFVFSFISSTSPSLPPPESPICSGLCNGSASSEDCESLAVSYSESGCDELVAVLFASEHSYKR